jgi:hypothetical protein
MTRHCVVFSLFFAASTAIVPEAGAAVIGQVVFSDGTYADADWTIVNQFGLIFAGQQPTGGHPGSYRQVALAVGQNIPFVGQLNKTYVYNPSMTGPISGITYTIDLETTNAEGATYFALLSQNGNLYIETMHTGNASPNTWLTENIVLDLADFALLRTNIQGNALIIDPNSRPNFSVSGSPITFGYEVTAGGAGFFTSITGIDNDPIILTVTPSAVPEPTSLSLLAIGMGFVAVAAARRGRQARTARPFEDRGSDS